MSLDADTVLLFLVFVLMAVDRVLNLLRSRGIDLQKMARQIDRLDELHAKTDDDGVPVWYVRRSLERSIDGLQEAIRSQTELLKELTMEIRHDRNGRGKQTMRPDGA